LKVSVYNSYDYGFNKDVSSIVCKKEDNGEVFIKDLKDISKSMPEREVENVQLSKSGLDHHRKVKEIGQEEEVNISKESELLKEGIIQEEKVIRSGKSEVNVTLEGKKVKVDGIHEIVCLFELVHASGMPNFQGCRIPLPNSKLKISAWRSRLRDYEDKIVCDFLQYGFPLDFDRKQKVSDTERKNHQGARSYPVFINKYLQKETSARRIIGPFESNPLSVPLIISPMNTVPKSCEDERRVIIDLSWPHGASVNDGISKTTYLGELINLHYASVEQVCQMVLRFGKGAHIYKRDLRHAYRQIPVDPRDYCYLGYFWENLFYVDTVLAMGQRNAAMACSRTTDAIMYMHAQDGHEGTNYLDDLIGVSDPHNSDNAFDALGKLLLELGLEENFTKACGPSTSQIVLGILVNTMDGTLAVPDEKLSEINLLVEQWQVKTSTTKVDLQSLIGKLQFVTKCVQQSRIFLNRLLETLRAMTNKSYLNLSESFKKDLRWWSLFMERFNGVSFIPPIGWAEPDITFSTDSCLTGCGGICGLEYFHVEFPQSIRIQKLAIHKLEMLAVLVGVRIWGQRLQGMRLQIYCDNAAAVQVINSSKTRDPFLASCLRELWLEVSTYGFELRAVHLPGEDNRVADWLSRWGINRRYQEQFFQFISTELESYVDIPITSDYFEFCREL
jgi:hypothetical protein